LGKEIRSLDRELAHISQCMITPYAVIASVAADAERIKNNPVIRQKVSYAEHAMAERKKVKPSVKTPEKALVERLENTRRNVEEGLADEIIDTESARLIIHDIENTIGSIKRGNIYPNTDLVISNANSMREVLYKKNTESEAYKRLRQLGNYYFGLDLIRRKQAIVHALDRRIKILESRGRAALAPEELNDLIRVLREKTVETYPPELVEHLALFPKELE
jgi:hypothetical protein